MRIGPLQLDSPLMLAPIAGHCDVAFRVLCRELGGVGIAFTDLLNSRAVLAGTSKSRQLAATCAADEPLGMQLYGNAEDPLPEAARWAIQSGAQLIDINMGCPVDKVAKKNGGSLLLRDCASTLGLVEKVLAAVESESGGAVPLTAKIRLGWDDDSIVGPTLARNLERVGVSAVTVHGRTTAQKFSGSANWRAIGEVVAAVKDIPIIGNGDVQDPQDVCELMRVSGCSGVMIGRASLRTPWIFARAKQLLDTNTAAHEPSFNDKCRVILRHIDLLEELTDPAYGLRTMRQKISRYGKTMGHVKSMKEAIRTAADFDTMRQAIHPWIQPHRDSISALVQREYHLQD